MTEEEEEEVSKAAAPVVAAVQHEKDFYPYILIGTTVTASL